MLYSSTSFGYGDCRGFGFGPYRASCSLAWCVVRSQHELTSNLQSDIAQCDDVCPNPIQLQGARSLPTRGRCVMGEKIRCWTTQPVASKALTSALVLSVQISAPQTSAYRPRSQPTKISTERRKITRQSRLFFNTAASHKQQKSSNMPLLL